ncbi:MAG TPA: pyridoxal-dependent decarboxylase [Terriglobales bacterium]|nr:pyridoxal-dependent decarboxylase [Terriglobales bacterium]
MGFELDSESRRQLGYRLIDHINHYFESLPTRAVQLPEQERSFAELRDSLPEMGDDAARVLDDVCREMIDKGFHVPSANYFGLMNPTPAYIAVLAEALVAALNPQLATMVRSQLASKIEQETVRWIGERVGWDRSFGGTFTSGGNEANFSAVALALTWKFPNVMEEGVHSIRGVPVIYASSEAHHSIDKSAGLLGIGRKAVRRIALNNRIQIDVDQLDRSIREDLAAAKIPFCVVATVGTTNSGAIDDLEAVASVCRRHKLWMHVDGAYGAAAIFSNKHRDLVRGIALAHSITIDPHKWLAMPFAAGVVLTSHPELLKATFGVITPYMPKANVPLPADNFAISTQWTRRMNSLKLWLTLRIHGREAYEQYIDRQIQLAKWFAEQIRKSTDFELFAEPMLPIFNLRLKSSDNDDQGAALQTIVDEVTSNGKQWISTTRVNGSTVIRVMIISYLTEQRHLEELLERLHQAARLVPRGNLGNRAIG